jgi:alkanesulfonate monooxygenase SsuD/methylene tetrahydromethanopterin reductase-like flavin-dependent oxidoreductase (luciferase family)
MRYALDIAPLGDLADPVTLVRIARAAEAAGWDGFSTWDSMGVSMGTVAPDPFVALAGVAAATERISLLLSVVALPRHRPWLVAQSAGTLDRLSGGRLVLGIGAGGDPGDYTMFGEPWAAPGRIDLMDEAADLVDAFLRGGAVTHHGPGWDVSGAVVGPRPVQEPRPSIWLGAVKPGGIRRAARWDGWIAVTVADDGVTLTMAPDGLASGIAIIVEARQAAGRTGEPFEVAVYGQAGLAGFAPSDYAAAGATWWLESVSPMRGSAADILAIAEAGPPRR